MKFLGRFHFQEEAKKIEIYKNTAFIFYLIKIILLKIRYTFFDYCIQLRMVSTCGWFHESN